MSAKRGILGRTFTSKSRVTRFLRRDDAGSVSLELVIWVPILMSAILLVADASAALTTQAGMWRAAGETARSVATGRITLQEANSQTVESSFKVYDQIAIANGVVTVELAKSYSEIGTGFLFAPIGEMRVRVSQVVEPHVNDAN